MNDNSGYLNLVIFSIRDLAFDHKVVIFGSSDLK